MRFSVKTEYGLKAMLFLAARWGGQDAPVREIAAREQIPERFLEQQVAALRKAGILQSQRGPSGGYRLARPPAEVSVLEVVQALEGPLLEVEGAEPSADPSAMAVHDLWRELADLLSARLAQDSIADLLARRDEFAAAGRDMFYI